MLLFRGISPHHTLPPTAHGASATRQVPHHAPPAVLHTSWPMQTLPMKEWCHRRGRCHHCGWLQRCNHFNCFPSMDYALSNLADTTSVGSTTASTG